MSVAVEAIEAQANAVADIMETHEVFGRHGTDHAFYEKHDFVRMVTAHVKENKPWDSLEVTYRNSDVRVVVTTQIVEGIATFKDVVAFNHPNPNPSLDYTELNEDIQEIVFN
jgi:hypothetical protein